MTTILFLAANPLETSRIRLDEELREIEEGLLRSDRRLELRLRSKWAVRARDVSRSILEVRPNIVHFSGHGRGSQGLCLEDEIGRVTAVSVEALSELFRLQTVRRTVQCVVLNACFSDIQAAAIGQHIDYVVGMPSALSDRAAVEFAVGFYDAIGAGEAIASAYEWGCAATSFAGVTRSGRPRLLVRGTDSEHPESRSSHDVGRAAEADTTTSKARTRMQTTSECRVCTVMYIDFSDALLPYHDLHLIQQVSDSCYAVIDEHVKAMDGVVERFVGDHALAVFGVPRGSDNDAERAITAADRIHAALSGVSIPRKLPQTRMSASISICTGRILAVPQGEGPTTRYQIIGDPLKAAARLVRRAERGATVISQETNRHVTGLFNVEPLDPVDAARRAATAYRVIGRIPLGQPMAPPRFYGLETRFVGRAAERQHLMDALETVTVERRAVLVTVTGAAGVGRSRLLSEFFAGVVLRSETFFLLTSQSSPLSQHESYGVVSSMIRQRFRIQEADPPKVVRHKLRRGIRLFLKTFPARMSVNRLGFGSEGSWVDAGVRRPAIEGIVEQLAQLLADSGAEPQDTITLSSEATTGNLPANRASASIVRALGMAAQRVPIVILCEDAHWADDASLAVLEELLVQLASLPILVVCSARSELFDRHPHWGESSPLHDRVDVGPLAPRHIEELIRDRLRYVPEIPSTLVRDLGERAEGNPLRVTEMLHFLVDTGVIEVRGEDPWVLHAERLGKLDLPATVQNVIQARLDRLSPRARCVLTQAAVIGRTFWLGALEHLHRSDTDGMSVTEIQDILDKLRVSQFIRVRPSTMLDERHDYVFHDSATCEVAYESLSHGVRRGAHLAIAEWLEGRSIPAAAAGTIAHHYDRGGSYRKALIHYTRAASVAFTLGDNANALNHIERVCGIYDELTAGRAPLEGAGASSPSVYPIAWTELVAHRMKRGDILCRLGRYDDAERDYDTARSLIPAVGGEEYCIDPIEPQRWSSRLDFRLAILLKLRGDRHDEALSVVTRAIEKATAANTLHETPPMYAFLAFLYRRLGDPEQSWQAARTGLRVCRVLMTGAGHRRTEVAELLLGIAAAQLARGKVIRAERAYRQAARAAPEGTHPHLIGIALNGVAGTHVKRGDMRAARAVYVRALQYKQRAGDLYHIAVGHSNLAEVELALQDPWSALEHARTAVQICEQIRANSDLADMYRNLAEAQRAVGDLAGAISSGERAVLAASSSRQAIYLVESTNALATICRQAMLIGGQSDSLRTRAGEALRLLHERFGALLSDRHTPTPARLEAAPHQASSALEIQEGVQREGLCC